PATLWNDASDCLGGRLEAAAADEKHRVGLVNAAERPLTKSSIQREVDADDNRKPTEASEPAGNRVDILLVAVDHVNPVPGDDPRERPQRSRERKRLLLVWKRQVESMKRSAVLFHPLLEFAANRRDDRRTE